MVILHHRVGGPATAAVLANAIPGLAGFGAALLTLHLTAVSLGIGHGTLSRPRRVRRLERRRFCDTAPASPHLSIGIAPNRD